MKRIYVLVLTFLIVLTSYASAEINRNVLENAGLSIEEVHVSIPGVDHPYHFLWVSDLHIVIDNDEIAEENHDLVAGRQNSWAITADGKQSGDWWVESLAEIINASNPDAIFFGGDMIDLCSEATITKLKAGLSKITVPYLYIRADHDSRPYWLEEQDEERSKKLQDSIGENGEIIILEYPNFLILGINNSTSQMSADTLEQVKEVAELNKPTIVITHVPYNSIVDQSLDEMSRAVWGDRNLTWGEGATYTPDIITSEWMDIVLSDNNLVSEVLAGHLHFTWDGMITERIHQHVFGAAFSGNVGLITVDGD